jgi:hypothetical protein
MQTVMSLPTFHNDATNARVEMINLLNAVRDRPFRSDRPKCALCRAELFPNGNETNRSFLKIDITLQREIARKLGEVLAGLPDNLIVNQMQAILTTFREGTWVNEDGRPGIQHSQSAARGKLRAMLDQLPEHTEVAQRNADGTFTVDQNNHLVYTQGNLPQQRLKERILGLFNTHISTT